MKEQIITFETAVLAKEKGFYWKVDNYYNIPNEKLHAFKLFKTKQFKLECAKGDYVPIDWNNSKFNNICLSAPTQSLLQKWLREVHDIHVVIVGSPKYSPCVMLDGTNYWRQDDELSYEEALEMGLQQALNLIK